MSGATFRIVNDATRLIRQLLNEINTSGDLATPSPEKGAADTADWHPRRDYTGLHDYWQ